MSEREAGKEVALKMADTAAAMMTAAGFAIVGDSSQGDARYFRRAGSAVQARIATYYHGHFNTVGLVFDAARCATGWYLTEAEIAGEVASLIKEYEAATNDAEEEEEEGGQ